MISVTSKIGIKKLLTCIDSVANANAMKERFVTEVVGCPILHAHGHHSIASSEESITVTVPLAKLEPADMGDPATLRSGDPPSRLMQHSLTLITRLSDLEIYSSVVINLL